jgi:hypothetical protein
MSDLKSEMLYHGSSIRIDGPLKPTVFGTDRKDIAAVFMFPPDILSSIGFEKDIAYICIWGTAEEFAPKDAGSFLYVLPSESFEKIGKEYEWLSSKEITPADVKAFPSVIDGMIECGAHVYFIDDEKTFDRIVAEKDHRAPILANMASENKKRGGVERGF